MLVFLNTQGSSQQKERPKLKECQILFISLIVALMAPWISITIPPA
jgi:hypothetical protein